MPGINSIDGIMSSWDTTSIVDAMIEAESGMVNYLRMRKAETTNIATTYQSISAYMLALKTSALSMARRSTFDLSSISVSDESVLAAETTSAVNPGTFSLYVNALARNHQIASQGFDSADSASIGTGTVQVSVGDGSTTTLTIDTTNNTLTGLKNAINAANIGITATVVDDGTSENAYRLILTANHTGKENTINFTTDLSGGTAPDFATAVFDDVETDTMTAASTSTITKGATASYTGNQNKTYTFTVSGTGAQTIGDGDITIQWTDGTYSGSIVVSAADTEVALTGNGADGLTLSFGAGDLNAGDSFTVQSFAPTLQVAADAQVSLGSTTGGGSPIIVSSATNDIKDLIPGMTLHLKGVSTMPVTIDVAINKDSITAQVNDLLSQYNTVMQQIDKQFSYSEETGEAGTLLGDSYLMSMQHRIRSALSGALSTLPPSMSMLASIGITTGDSGQLYLSQRSKLYDAIDDDFEAVKNLFTDSGTSTNRLVQFITATIDTEISAEGYEVNITQAATQGYLKGSEIYNPATEPIVIDSTNKNLKITVDGVISETITLTEKTYTSNEDLVHELQNKIDADDKIGMYGLSVEWVDTGADTGYLRLISPSFGVSSTVNVDLGLANSANQELGLATAQASAGQNVAGTINGEPATGAGRVLTGDEGNAYTDGLQLLVSLTAADLTENPEAVVTYSEGFAARLNRVVDSITRSVDGVIARRTDGLNDQIEYYDNLIEDYEERLAERREELYRQFYEMEKALADLESQNQYLGGQLAQLSSLLGT